MMEIELQTRIEPLDIFQLIRHNQARVRYFTFKIEPLIRKITSQYIYIFQGPYCKFMTFYLLLV